MITAALPRLDPDLVPPRVLGLAALTQAALRGADGAALAAMIANAGHATRSAYLFDHAILAQLMFDRTNGLARLDAALSDTRVFRVSDPAPGAPRLLGICQPGDLMANTPLDCLTTPAGIGLDLVVFDPVLGWPATIPAHDVAFMAAAEPMPEDALNALTAAALAWPRPVLNNPARLPGLRREVLWQILSGFPGVVVPRTCWLPRQALTSMMDDKTLPAQTLDIPFPMLIRPAGSHAGKGLRLIVNRSELAAAFATDPAESFQVCRFVDYRSRDGKFRKFRVALVNGRPRLCHLAISDHWMVHYLNAGMAIHAERRAEEATAFREFDTGFARRHAEAFQFIHERLHLDWLVLDCAELPDRRLLVFEADTAAIVHGMDAVGDFAYKAQPMKTLALEFRAWVSERAVRARVMELLEAVGPNV